MRPAVSLPHDNLLRVPAGSPWMTTGTTRGGAAAVTPTGSSWDLHLAGNEQPRRVRTLAAAESALSAAAGGGGVDVHVIAQLDDACRRHLDASDVATGAADELNERAYLLRAFGIGFHDVGYLLDMHEHRGRLLLTDPAARPGRGVAAG